MQSSPLQFRHRCRYLLRRLSCPETRNPYRNPRGPPRVYRSGRTGPQSRERSSPAGLAMLEHFPCSDLMEMWPCGKMRLTEALLGTDCVAAFESILSAL